MYNISLWTKYKYKVIKATTSTYFHSRIIFQINQSFLVDKKVVIVSLSSKMMYSIVVFSPQPKDIQFTEIEE